MAWRGRRATAAAFLLASPAAARPAVFGRFDGRGGDRPDPSVSRADRGFVGAVFGLHAYAAIKKARLRTRARRAF